MSWGLTLDPDDPVTWMTSGPLGPSVAKDGPDQVYAPSTADEWLALGLPAPASLWPMQEASGNLSDVVGAVTLTATASPLYQQSVTGWARKFVGTTVGTANQRFDSSSASLDLAAGESAAWLVYAAISDVSAATRRWFRSSWGTAPDINGLYFTSAGLLASEHKNVAATGLSHVSSTVRPFLWYRNATTNASGCLTDLQSLVGTHDESATTAGSTKGIGVALSTAPPTGRYGLLAFWRGADAETIAAKATLTTLRWSVAW